MSGGASPRPGDPCPVYRGGMLTLFLSAWIDPTVGQAYSRAWLLVSGYQRTSGGQPRQLLVFEGAEADVFVEPDDCWPGHELSPTDFAERRSP